MTTKIVERRFIVTAGILIRGEVMRAMRNYCFKHFLDLTIDEDRGWIESTLRCTVLGPKGDVDAFLSAVQFWMDELGAS